MENSREDEFEKFARWYALPLDKSEDGIYLALETQSAWAACQHQQAKVEGLEKENQRLADGNTSYYNQAIKQNEIIDGLQGKLKQAYEDIDTFATAHEALEQRVDRDRSLIQFTQKANKDLIAERDELQKRVDQQGLIIVKVMSIASDLQKSWSMFEIGKKLEQALKGGEV